MPNDSIQYHVARGDFTKWIAEALDDPHLAESIEGLNERHELINVIKERRELLWSHIK